MTGSSTTTSITSAEAAAFMLSAVLTSAPIFLIAFNLGAYGEVFFEHLFTLWAASIAALLAGLAIGRTVEGESYCSLTGTLLLSIPTLWMLDEAFLFGIDAPWALMVKNILTFAAVGLSLPYTLYFVAMAVVPDLDRLASPKLKVWLLAIWLTVAGTGFAVGMKNDWFLTCHDFEISGNAKPDNCWSNAR